MVNIRRSVRLTLAAALLALAAEEARAHPGSGIVVDARGEVYFVHSGRGVAKIDAKGELSWVHASTGGHWLALDADGAFARAEPPWFARITPPGQVPALIFADGGSPIVVDGRGALVYVCGPTGDRLEPGGLRLASATPGGKPTLLIPGSEKTIEPLGGVSGLATGPGGTVYVACPAAILKVGRDGTVATLANPVAVPDCTEDAEPTQKCPYLRGLAVDDDGTVYAAATDCRRVLKITPGGRVETALTAERPWTPTGVAIARGELYVLEYNDFRPSAGLASRVRKLGRDGKITTLATVAPASRTDERPTE